MIHKNIMCEHQEYNLILDNNLNRKQLNFIEFPNLKIIYIRSQNNLCPSYYSDDTVCIQAGNLQMILNVNGELITLTSNMKNEIIVGDYKLKGLDHLVKNKSRQETYLIISIEKCNNNQKTYNVGQPFILEFQDNPSTGYSWDLEISSGIKIIKDTHSNRCKEGITGCGGIRTFVLEGTKNGKQIVIATHGRSWDPSTNTKYIYEYNIL